MGVKNPPNGSSRAAGPGVERSLGVPSRFPPGCLLPPLLRPAGLRLGLPLRHGFAAPLHHRLEPALLHARSPHRLSPPEGPQPAAAPGRRVSEALLN